jgi:hypothetical protein
MVGMHTFLSHLEIFAGKGWKIHLPSLLLETRAKNLGKYITTKYRMSLSPPNPLTDFVGYFCWLPQLRSPEIGSFVRIRVWPLLHAV